MKVVIMAGGQGTRIASVTQDIPKPMIPIENKPILEHELICLREQGFTDIILVIGHLGNIIKDYFGSGENFGVNIKYFQETSPLGTAGALYYLKEDLQEEFLLLNGDIIFDINFSKMIFFHNSTHALVTLLTHPNSHPYDSAIIITDSSKKVVQWLNKEEPRNQYKNRVNAGIHILSPNILDIIQEAHKTDLDRDILKPLVTSGRIYAYDSPEYIQDMGTPERYYRICEDVKKGNVRARNLCNKQKAIFLDRDGTINKFQGFITNPNSIELLDGVADAIKKINSSNYLAIVITNQPVIARGECTLSDLEKIHNKLETELGKKGAYLDDIFYCPHHPDSGFEGERKEYKFDCDCRKPKPGMLLNAAQKYNIDLSTSYMVGDSIRDVEAGKAAGCRSILLNEENANGFDCFDNLLHFVENILDD